MPVPIAEGLLFLALTARAEDVSVAPRAVPAAGRHTAVIDVPAFGRYAVMAHSPQGTAVQIVDRMAGPGVSDGVPGGEDGRVDVFLDRGLTQVVLTSDPGGTGEARVDVQRFTEIATADEVLVDHRIVEGELRDLEQRTFWVEIAAPTDVAYEAAGRGLADLRVWRDGAWLVDAAPRCADTTPARGRTLTGCQLTARLEPGLYAIVAYGGPAHAWSDAPDESPLYVRAGIPRLPSVGRAAHAISPFGVDRFVVPSGPDSFVLELPKSAPATLAVGPYDAAAPFGGWSRSAVIADDTRVPLARVSATVGQPSMVTVTGAAGQPYLLTTFAAVRSGAIVPAGAWFLATIAAGAPEDRLDATGFVVVDVDDHVWLDRAPAATAYVPLGAGSAWHRRFNLEGHARLYVDARETATYVIDASPDVSYRVEPTAVGSARYREPPWLSGRQLVDLSAGAYTITFSPTTPGIADVSIAAEDDPVPVATAPIAAVQFAELTLPAAATYRLYVDPTVPTGLVARALPVDLADALPIALRPGEVVEVRVTVGERGRIAATLEDGSAAAVAIDGGAFGQSADVDPGEHRAAIRQTSTRSQVVSLGFTARDDLAETPPPTLPAGLRDALPKFPPLVAGAPAYLDLARDGSATYAMRVEEPGLYALTSTGLLATRGSARTRTIVRFADDSQGGVGRNFAVSRYLGTGDYQVTVGAEGLSAGHLGLRLDQRAIRDGGVLADGIPARIGLAAGEGAVYKFKIATAGSYSLQTFGPAGPFRARLEDRDGWPLQDPNAPATVDRWFEPGDYRWLVLPEDRPSQRITSLVRAPDPFTTVGHGPFAATIDGADAHVWRETPDGERVPDAWTFALSAPTAVSVVVDGEMTGEIYAADGSIAGRVVVGHPFDQALAAGAYTVKLVNARRNDAVPYTVQIRTTALIPGSNRTIAIPGTAEVSIGTDGLVALGSFGATDVRAELFDAAGARVATSDDRPDDWNFLLFERLTAGTYSLRVTPVGEGRSTTVFVRAPAEKAAGALALATATASRPGDDVLLYDVAPPDAGLLVVSATSTENVEVAVEARIDGVFRTVGRGEGASVVVPTGLARAATAWRVRVRSLDHRGGKVVLRADVATGEGAERAFASGVVLKPPAKGLRYGVAAIRADRGTFAVRGPDGLLACDPDCRPVDGAVPIDALTWFVGAPKSKVEADRIRLDDAARVALDGPTAIDLAEHDGPVVLITEGSAPSGVRLGDSAATAYGERGAVGVSLDGAGAALLWPAGSGPVEVRVARRAFAPVSPGRIGLGRTEGTLASGNAVAYDRAAGPTDARLTLGKGLIAVLSGDGPERALWADAAAVTYLLDAVPPRITLLSVSGEAVPYALELQPDDGAVAAIVPGAPLIRRAGGETAVIEVPDVDGTLAVLGAGSARLVDADGTVRSGLTFALRGGGVLLADTVPGALIAWIERDGEGSAALFGPLAGTATATIAPARVPIAGTVTGIAMAPGSAGMITIRTSGPTIAQVRRANGTSTTILSGDGEPLHIAVAAGPVEVWLRGALAPLAGVADVAFTAATPIGEGLGAEIAIGPGDARLFRLDVAADGPIGIGLRADAEHVTAVLYDAEGAEVARGAAIMPRLTAGTWLLGLTIAEGTRPVRVRPAVVGIEAPGNGPPADVVLSYLPADVN